MPPALQRRHGRNRLIFVICLLFASFFVYFYLESRYMIEPLPGYSVRPLPVPKGVKPTTPPVPKINDQVNCPKVWKQDKKYLKKYKTHRTVLESSDEILKREGGNCTCVQLFSRHEDLFIASKAQVSKDAFPIAFAKNVYTDYDLLELDLASSYARKNFYCYAIDSKSSYAFKQGLRRLARCLPNVILSESGLNITSEGQNTNKAHVECLKKLVNFEWEYVVLLQNHDTPIKTNSEMVAIFRVFNGSNDVEIRDPMLDRLTDGLNWSFKALKLFKDPSRYKTVPSPLTPELNFAKGYVEASLSRAAVDMLIHELDLTILLDQLNKDKYGIDEILFPTLQVTDALNLPGGFTHTCLDKGIDMPYRTRYSNWKTISCATGYIRHQICIFGAEDVPGLERQPYLFANKFLPDFDWGAIVCWYEKLRARQRDQVTLNLTTYENLPNIRYQRERQKPGFLLKNFSCRE